MPCNINDWNSLRVVYIIYIDNIDIFDIIYTYMQIKMSICTFKLYTIFQLRYHCISEYNIHSIVLLLLDSSSITRNMISFEQQFKRKIIIKKKTYEIKQKTRGVALKFVNFSFSNGRFLTDVCMRIILIGHNYIHYLCSL